MYSFSIEGEYPQNPREILLGKEVADTIGAKAGSSIQLTYKPTVKLSDDVADDWVPGATLSGSAEGWNSALVTVALSLDEEGKVASVSVDASTQTPEIGGLADFSYPTSLIRRGRVQGGGTVIPTITATPGDVYYIEEGNKDMYSFIYEDDDYEYYIRLRRLSPRENWRLMGFPDEAFDKASSVNSNCQLFKQAGNSIALNALVAVIGQFFEGKEDFYKSFNAYNP